MIAENLCVVEPTDRFLTRLQTVRAATLVEDLTGRRAKKWLRLPGTALCACALQGDIPAGVTRPQFFHHLREFTLDLRFCLRIEPELHTECVGCRGRRGDG